MEIPEPYRERAIRFLDLWDLGGWKIKAYGIAYAGERPSATLVDAGRLITTERLAASTGDMNHYGVGFVGIHEGKTGNFIFVDWWADENELHHHVYRSSSGSPAALEYLTPSGLIACTWDLFLIAHERDAWVDNVLGRVGGPDIAGYLDARLDTMA